MLALLFFLYLKMFKADSAPYFFIILKELFM